MFTFSCVLEPCEKNKSDYYYGGGVGWDDEKYQNVYNIISLTLNEIDNNRLTIDHAQVE